MNQETLVRLGNSSWCSIAGPIARQVERRELALVGDADRALRVADLDVLEAPAAAAGGQLARAVVARPTG